MKKKIDYSTLDLSKAGMAYSRDHPIAEEYASDPPINKREAHVMGVYVREAIGEFARRADKYEGSASTKDKEKFETFSRAAKNLNTLLKQGDKKIARRENVPAVSVTTRAAGIIGIASLAVSLFFFSEGITGNIIGVSGTTPNIIGIILLAIGLIGGYWSVKR